MTLNARQDSAPERLEPTPANQGYRGRLPSIGALYGRPRECGGPMQFATPTHRAGRCGLPIQRRSLPSLNKGAGFVGQAAMGQHQLRKRLIGAPSLRFGQGLAHIVKGAPFHAHVVSLGYQHFAVGNHLQGLHFACRNGDLLTRSTADVAVLADQRAVAAQMVFSGQFAVVLNAVLAAIRIGDDRSMGLGLGQFSGNQVHGVHLRRSPIDRFTLDGNGESVNSVKETTVMSTIENVRALAASGKWAKAISEELGISRQRVYQIARDHGITLPKNEEYPRKATARAPEARVVTGGVPAPINHTVAGTISELLVAADLMARGWKVFMPIIPSKGHDLIGMKDGRLVTFEVRSAHRNVSGTVKFAKRPDCMSDHYAMVITGEPVSYDPEIGEPPL